MHASLQSWLLPCCVMGSSSWDRGVCLSWGLCSFGLAWISDLCSGFWRSLGKVAISQSVLLASAAHQQVRTEPFSLDLLNCFSQNLTSGGGTVTHLLWPRTPDAAFPGGGGQSQGGFLSPAQHQRNSTAQRPSRAPSGFQQLMWGTRQLVPPTEDSWGECAT